MDSHPEIPEKIADIKRTLANLSEKISAETYTIDDFAPFTDTNASLRSNKIATPMTTVNSGMLSTKDLVGPKDNVAELRKIIKQKEALIIEMT